MSNVEHRSTKNTELYEFGGFDMEWSYYSAAGRQAASCPTCDVRTKVWQRPRKAQTKKLPYDFNDTNDGKVIISARAKEHLETYWPGQIRLRQIFENAWEAEPVRVLVVQNPDDLILYSTEFKAGDNTPCPDCGFHWNQTFKGCQYRFENPEIIAEDGIFRTDIEFGGPFRDPLWLAGPKAAFAISARFREVWLRHFEKTEKATWRFLVNEPFRADAEPGASEPTYPEFLE
ncbi:hypothetical protein [Actibacterium ureilyticum]|uniref:hypothetical protein n=1 Tax=Actibacterium ureilyticum TaxID=1590614 RepID=UPI001140C043|nr:hypothetical protein [Actibacterium ureilyticum]